eukprot:4546408-Pleurochrysis_carterae.AAC.3
MAALLSFSRRALHSVPAQFRVWFVAHYLHSPAPCEKPSMHRSRISHFGVSKAVPHPEQEITSTRTSTWRSAASVGGRA